MWLILTPAETKRRLEAFNGVLQHQLSANPNLVYTALQSHKAFEDLGTFTLAKGLREIKRIRELKEERAAAAKNAKSTKGKAPASATAGGGTAEEVRRGEKVGLMERERERETPRQSAEERRKSDATEDDSASLNSTNGGANTPGATPSTPTTGGAGRNAKGKMRETSLTLELDAELDGVAAAGVGRNGFVPTQEWVSRLFFLGWVRSLILIRRCRSRPGSKGKPIISSLPICAHLPLLEQTPPRPRPPHDLRAPPQDPRDAIVREPADDKPADHRFPTERHAGSRPPASGGVQLAQVPGTSPGQTEFSKMATLT
jgi:hypothetical protein